ncbi:hypothetical protein SAMN05421812_10512 [Asanoa hainanensis]|uniref:Uncharacterized protein n=1 Tax=Asanoa hainanensis TaxID=560556 RepID=A0A239M1Y3_9ACTN|nr:hypothetical protein SAMN05421812_10512 [Asanoa hainanensis]
MVTIVSTVGLLLVVGFRSVRRRGRARLSAMEQARRATRELRRENRALRGGRGRGDGEHFWRTKLGRYGDERHGDDGGGGGFSDSGGGSGGGSD